MNPDMVRLAKERLELALQALESGDCARCGRLAISAAQLVSEPDAKAVPAEIADWPQFSIPEAWGYHSESKFG